MWLSLKSQTVPIYKKSFFFICHIIYQALLSKVTYYANKIGYNIMLFIYREMCLAPVQQLAVWQTYDLHMSETAEEFIQTVPREFLTVTNFRIQ